MLVLARGKNESIIINDDIEITIVEIKPDQVKIGIQAPKSVKVNRKEVYERIKIEMKKAAASQLPNFDAPHPTSPPEATSQSEDQDNDSRQKSNLS